MCLHVFSEYLPCFFPSTWMFKCDFEKERKWNRGDICGSPPKGKRASRLALYRALRALMLLLLSPLIPTAKHCDTAADKQGQITRIMTVILIFKVKIIRNPQRSLCCVSSRTESHYDERAGGGFGVWPEDIFVSCCLGQFNWEANLLPLLLEYTQCVLWNKWTKLKTYTHVYLYNITPRQNHLSCHKSSHWIPHSCWLQ